MITKEEFIIECTMRNMQAAISRSGTYQCIESGIVDRCVNISKALADKLYDK